MPSIAIIGGGVVGRCCAFHLQSRGFDVTVLDDDPALAAPSWNNAGHIATEQPAPLASIAAIRSAPGRLFRVGGALDFDFSAPGIYRWIWRYLRAATPRRFAKGKAALGALVANADKAWAALAEELGEPALVQNAGHWVLWESSKSAAKGLQHWQQADIGTAAFAPLSQDALEVLEKKITEPLQGGIAFTGTGQVARHQALAKALKAAFIARGGQWLSQSAAPLVIKEGRATLPGGADFDKILVCAGAASAKVLASIHPGVPLMAERGYHIEADCDDSLWPAGLPPVVFEDRSLIVTRFGDRLRACSFVELSSLDAKPDPRKWQQLLRHAAELGLPFAHNLSQWHGARPTLPDYLPAMGQSDKASNLFYAFGHQHLGLTLAPATAILLGQLLSGEKMAQPLAPFSLARFGC